MPAWQKNTIRLSTSYLTIICMNYLDLWGNYTLLIDLYSKLLPEDHLGNEILLEDKGNHGAILGNLGIAYNNLGDPRKAIEYYEKALKIAQEIGDRRGEGNQLGNLGLAYSDLGDPSVSTI